VEVRHLRKAFLNNAFSDLEPPLIIGNGGEACRSTSNQRGSKTARCS